MTGFGPQGDFVQVTLERVRFRSWVGAYLRVVGVGVVSTDGV